MRGGVPGTEHGCEKKIRHRVCQSCLKSDSCFWNKKIKKKKTLSAAASERFHQESPTTAQTLTDVTYILVNVCWSQDRSTEWSVLWFDRFLNRLHQVLTQVWPSLSPQTLHLPVDIVGHCHEHQRPANAGEDHHSALVQHCGCRFFTNSKPEITGKKKTCAQRRTVTGALASQAW